LSENTSQATPIQIVSSSISIIDAERNYNGGYLKFSSDKPLEDKFTFLSGSGVSYNSSTREVSYNNQIVGKLDTVFFWG
jgi:hypothetical protein